MATNKTGCEIRTRNTKESRCAIELGLYRRVVLVPLNAFWTGLDRNGDPQTFDEWLEALIHEANPKKRAYPMPAFTDCQPDVEEPVTWTNPYGQKFYLRDGNTAFVQAFNRDRCLNKRLLAFNNQSFRAIIFDNENRVLLTRNANGLTGGKCTVFVTLPNPNTATELSEPTISYTFTESDEQKSAEIINSDLKWGDIQGLEDVYINIIKDTVNYVITFSAGCSGEDITSELAALDGEATAWKVQVGASNPVQISTAPNYDTNREAFIIPVASLTTYNKIGLASPDVLYSLGITNKDCSEMVAIPS